MITSVTYWLLKTLLNIGINTTDNIASTSMVIAYKRPILVGAIPCGCPFIDHKKRYPNGQVVT
jgi:hypothetical protein